MPVFKEWMAASSAAQKQRLSRLSRVGLSHLYQIAQGRRMASSDAAARIEEASKGIGTDGGNLPMLARGDISAVCGECPYYKKCHKVKIKKVKLPPDPNKPKPFRHWMH